ncbi:hepatocyte growth factor receptor-like [Physella acuta]|uniref:hepatocyte growth factor receptor-like n=1 Tax=Physella acuta TaxID=109671 RepID=UPI0027DC342F|nr:hepatocyte growth factor receptor-like [Physella acuta]
MELFLYFVLVCEWVLLCGGQEEKDTTLNLGATITKLAVSDEYVYVGGVNFVAQLTKPLDVVLFNLTIGPVLKDEDCRPQTVPCDNQVMVMEIDANLGWLVVCGTAYRGTCTLHSLSDITVWRCLYGDNGADILAGDVTHTTVFKFLPPVNNNNLLSQSFNFSQANCNGDRFTFNSFDPVIHNSSPLKDTTMASVAIVARGDMDSAGSDPMIISLRQITYVNDMYVISHLLDGQSTPKGVYINATERSKFNIDFKLSFTWGEYSYLISTQVRNEAKVVVLSRVETGNVLSLVEIVLECRDEMYNILKAASLGLIGTTTFPSADRYPILFVAFGTADGKEADILCSYELKTMNDQEIAFVAIDIQNLGELVPWVHASHLVPSERSGLYFRLKSAIRKEPMFTSNSTIRGIHTLDAETDVQVLMLGDSNRIERISVSDVLLVAVLNDTIIKSWTESETVGQKTAIGSLDQSNQVLYLATGDKLTNMSTNFCKQFNTCTECHAQGNECYWILARKTCIKKPPYGNERIRCPPVISRFSPQQVPSKGGSILTLRGEQFSTPDSQTRAHVSVCDIPCDNVTVVNNTFIRCSVPARCQRCLSNCTIKIDLRATNSNQSYGNASTDQMSGKPRLQYVVPVVESVLPTKGPISGGTVLTVRGRFLNSGSNRTISLADRTCTVIETSTNEAKCWISNSSSPTRHNPANISLTIDAFTETFNRTQFHFLPDPVVYSISPKNSFISGGSKVTISGSSLDSVQRPQLILGIRLTSVLEMPFTNCTLFNNGSQMICKSPNLKTTALDQDSNFHQGKFNKTYLVVSMDNYNTTRNSTAFVIHKDPYIRSFNDFSKPLTVAHSQIVLKGENIPTWLDKQEIEVTLGLTRCPVTHINTTTITCNGSEMATKMSLCVLQMKKLQTTPSPTETSTFVDKELTTQPFIFFNETSTIKNAMSLQEGPTTPSTLPLSQSTTQPSQSPTTASRVTPSRPTTPTRLPPSRPTTPPMTIKECYTQDNNFFRFNVSLQVGNIHYPLGHMRFESSSSKTEPTTMPASMKIILASISAVAVAAIVVAATFCFVRRSKAKALQKSRRYFDRPSKDAAPVPTLQEILESVIEPEKLGEISQLIIGLDRLTVGKSIGSGNFGCVFEGLLDVGPATPALKVAIKTLQDSMSHSIDLKGFVQEAVMMREFQHPNVLGLVGLSEKERGVPYVVLPFMENGDLLTYVRDSAVTLTLHDVIKFGADIADGMSYLSSLKFVHRDLAARNCMLDSVHRAKVADFGLCRDIYEKGYYTSDNKKKLPIRWMAIESIEHGAYSTKSDVWSFGVVLWEMLTRGVTPYPGVDGWDVINFLRQRRLPPPHFCPEELYNLMMQCWAKDPNLRPSFKALHCELLAMIGQTSPDSPTTYLNNARKTSQNTDDPAPATPTLFTFQPYMNLSTGDSQKRNEITKPVPKSRKTKPSSDRKTGGASFDGDEVKVGAETARSVVRNCAIIIPVCYSHREVTKNAAELYLQLVDNYESAPVFSNELAKLTKKKSHSKPSKQKAKTHSMELSETHSMELSEIHSMELSETHSMEVSGEHKVVLDRDARYYELQNMAKDSSG